jgi:hypothetical protein
MLTVLGGGIGVTGYNLTRSLRTRASASASLTRTPAASNRQTWTWSGWVKRGVLNNGSVQSLFGATADTDNFCMLSFTDFTNSPIQFAYVVGGNDSQRIRTTAVYRDPSAWYHIVLSIDTTQATAANRMKLYVNGSQVTAFSYASYPSQNANMWVNAAISHGIAVVPSVAGNFDGYLAEVNFIDGQALTPSSFGSTNALTGVWQPARYTGTYGTNGFYLPFTDNSALTTSSNVGLGKDFSGNGNYWTTNNISLTAGVTYDSMTDVPTLTSATAANFGVLNPIGNGSGTISNGNLRAVTSTTLPDVGNFAMQSGKWYWEVTLTVSSNPRIGMYDIGKALPTAVGMGGTNSWAIINGPSRLYYQGTIVAYGSFVGSSGSVLMIAYDPTNGNLWFGENGSWFASGNPATGANPSLTGVTGTAIVAAAGSGSGSNTFDYNFGQRPFSYSPPTGFVSLNTYNLPDSTIVKGNTVMDATLYTGTGASLSVTNTASFKPDLVWVKSRSAATDHKLTDSVRGVTKGLISDTTGAETTDTNGLTAFNANGWSLGTDTVYNNNASTYVGWQWQAGQGSSSSNTNGTITSTVSVNASAGFSVVTYTGNGTAGATIGHGLGVAPSLIIVKERSSNVSGWNAWIVYHSSIGATGNLVLNTAASTNTAIYAWNNTAPTSSVFTIAYSAGAGVNYTSNYVAYCWTPIAGYSAFGSYTGNGSTDGPFVYTGFRPKFVLVKDASNANNWQILDIARDTYNVATNIIQPNLSNAESAFGSGGIDFLSNGFKVRTSSTGINTSGATVIYAAFAESPFRNSLAR